MPDTRTPLVGRDRHVRELRHLVDAISAGSGYAVALSGEAGAGKTRLAEEAAGLANGSGVRVAWATCWRSAAAPLSVWADLVAATAPGAATSPAPPAGADPEAVRSTWIRTLVADFHAALDDEPTIVVVDDLQWADPLSLLAIEQLAATVRSMRAGLLVTVRDDAEGRPASVERLTRTSRHLVVPPLTEAELGTLAADRTGRRLTTAALVRLHDRTAGNVLFALELLDESRRHPTLAEPERRPPSTASTAIFSERLAALSTECQQVLQAASVIGRRFRLDILAEALATESEWLLDVLGEAEAAGLVRGPGIRGFEFAHPLVAEACYRSGGVPRRVRLHREVAEALERLRARGLPIAPVEIAHHFANAAAAGVAEKAADYAAMAGHDDMAQLAFEDAVRDYGLALQALELCPADDGTRGELLLALGDATAATGDRAAARDAYEAAARLAREHGRHDVLARAALGVGSGPGGFEVPPFDDHQIALLEEAAAVASGALRAHVLGRLSVALALEPRALARREALSSEAIALAREAGDALALGYALASWCDVVPGPDAVELRLAGADEILRCASRAEDLRLELLARRLRVVALLELGRLVDFDLEVAAYAVKAERVGQPGYAWYVPLWQAMRAAVDGRLEVAEQLGAAAGSIGAAAHSDNAALLVGSQRAMLSCELRAGAGAVAFFEEVIDRFPDYTSMALPGLAYAKGAVGDVESARAIVRGLDPGDYTVEAFGSELLTTLLVIAHGSWLAGVDDHAAQLYGALLPHRERFYVDGIGAYFAGSVERTLGILASQCGDVGTARAHFVAALEHHRRLRSPVLVAVTLRDGGRCLGDPVMVRDADAQLAALGLTATAPSSRAGDASTSTGPVFGRAGDLWLVRWDGEGHHLRHTKGMGDLARLLAQPGREVHVLDLVDTGATLDSGSTGDPLDATARRRYRARLEEIESDLAEADARADRAGSERLELEREALVAELSAAYGLGGRARRPGASSERARSAVTQRIRDAITRIGRVEPALASHLRHAVRTGTYCAYEPEHPVEWELSAPSDQ